MRFLRLLILIPALCLGLLGQGHDWVLCQTDRCVCLETEGLCGCTDGSAQGSDSAQTASVEKETGSLSSEGKKGCQDLSLDAGTHLAPKPVEMPNLALFPLALLNWEVRPLFCAVQAGDLPCQARGPPGQWRSSPPQVLACVCSVVMVI